MFTMRFDLRVPPGVDLQPAVQYGEALKMVKWADQHGFAGVGLSEHHDADDGFMHSPLTLAAAFLASSTNLSCSVAALLLPLHDPVRVAEEIATIDLLAPGRLSVIVGLGYRALRIRDVRQRSLQAGEGLRRRGPADAGRLERR